MRVSYGTIRLGLSACPGTEGVNLEYLILSEYKLCAVSEPMMSILASELMWACTEVCSTCSCDGYDIRVTGEAMSTAKSVRT